MSYTLNPDSWYRSPIHFGPMLGPRQDPNEQAWDLREQPHRALAVVQYLTERAAIEQLLPDNMTLDGEPIVTVEVQVFSELAWLAGRGYSTVNVKFPVLFKGKKDTARGQFLAVIWENLADPIISGREELGYSKVFADIPPERVQGDRRIFTMGWGGHEFFKLELSNLTELAQEQYPKGGGDGVLHVKYVPGTPHGSPPDAHYVTMTPNGNSHLRILRVLGGRGSAIFAESTWEQIPTLYRIVNSLAKLPQIEQRNAYYMESRGGKDLSDQCRLD